MKCLPRGPWPGCWAHPQTAEVDKPSSYHFGIWNTGKQNTLWCPRIVIKLWFCRLTSAERTSKSHPRSVSCVCVSVSTSLHSEVSVDITGQVLSVKQEVVTNNIECQAGTPVGSWVIWCGTTSSPAACRRVSMASFLLLRFFFQTLRDHRKFAVWYNDSTFLGLFKLFTNWLQGLEYTWKNKQ